MKEIKETILMGVLGVALAVGLSAAANDPVELPPVGTLDFTGQIECIDRPGQFPKCRVKEADNIVEVDPCAEATSDPMVAFKCLMGEMKGETDEAAKALCDFKEEFEAAPWQRLGYERV